MLLIVAVLGTAALKLPPARTRAHALACKALLQKDSTKEDSADQVAPVPLKSSRRGPVGMLLEPGYIPGRFPTIHSTTTLHRRRPQHPPRTASLAGSVTIVGNSRIVGDLPGWLLPIASAACYSLPLLSELPPFEPEPDLQLGSPRAHTASPTHRAVLYLSGDMDRDTYRRARSGGTLKRRAISDFVRGLQRIGLLPEQRPPVASALGCARVPPQTARSPA